MRLFQDVLKLDVKSISHEETDSDSAIEAVLSRITRLCIMTDNEYSVNEPSDDVLPQKYREETINHDWSVALKWNNEMTVHLRDHEVMMRDVDIFIAWSISITADTELV